MKHWTDRIGYEDGAFDISGVCLVCMRAHPKDYECERKRRVRLQSEAWRRGRDLLLKTRRYLDNAPVILGKIDTYLDETEEL